MGVGVVVDFLVLVDQLRFESVVCEFVSVVSVGEWVTAWATDLPDWLASWLAQGLTSKSNRTKIECCGEAGRWFGRVLEREMHRGQAGACEPVTSARFLPVPLLTANPSPWLLPSPTNQPTSEEIACIIERDGMAPVHQARSKPMAAVAALLKERDGATRSAALGAIEQAWAEEGEGVFKLLGRCGAGLCVGTE